MPGDESLILLRHLSTTVREWLGADGRGLDDMLRFETTPMATVLWIGLALAGAFLLLILAGMVYQQVGAAADARRHPPRGRIIEVAGRSVHIHMTGEGSPTVVLESGMGASTLSWSVVQPRVADFARVVSYDRAGVGWSGLAQTPRTAVAIAEELHALLAEAGLAGPYVLVGHSFGAYVLLAFSGRYPDEVQGMVLVDAIHPDEWRSPTPQQLRTIRVGARYARVAAWLAQMGFVRFCLARLARGSPRLGRAASRAFGEGTASAARRIAGEIRKLPRDAWPIVRAFWSLPKSFLSLEQHVEALPVSAAQAAAAGSLGSLPLLVLSGNHHSLERMAEQKALAALSTRGKHLVVKESEHWIHLDQPELVAWAIREVVQAGRLERNAVWVN